jgi:hypothetical protein
VRAFRCDRVVVVVFVVVVLGVFRLGRGVNHLLKFCVVSIFF